MKNQTQIVEMDIERLIPADWNYKADGTEEQYEKLIKSIEQDKSVGVLAVREVEREGQQLFEVMDGNHRLEAIKRMGWEKVPTENFGEISLATAVTIARRRNHNWFEDDKMALMKLMKDEVLTVYTAEELSEYMPESVEEIEAYKNISEFEWAPGEEKQAPQDEEGFKTVVVKVKEETYNMWQKWVDRLHENLSIDSPSTAFEYAVIEALNVPEEKLVERRDSNQ